VYPTAEVRWFWPGEVPRAVLDWLSAWPVPPEVQAPRVDRYARLPAGTAETVSLKLREGRLEVKWRHEEWGLVRLAPGAWGMLECWRKQILPASEAGEVPVAGLAVGGDSIAVAKARRLARFRVADGGQVTAAPGSAASRSAAPGSAAPESAACEFEVTAVRARGQVWWTACFEAFGAAEAELEDTLRRVVVHVLAAPHPLTLGAEHSFSYPEWLVRLEAP